MTAIFAIAAVVVFMHAFRRDGLEGFCLVILLGCFLSLTFDERLSVPIARTQAADPVITVRLLHDVGPRTTAWTACHWLLIGDIRQPDFGVLDLDGVAEDKPSSSDQLLVRRITPTVWTVDARACSPRELFSSSPRLDASAVRVRITGTPPALTDPSRAHELR